MKHLEISVRCRDSSSKVLYKHQRAKEYVYCPPKRCVLELVLSFQSRKGPFCFCKNLQGPLRKQVTLFANAKQFLTWNAETSRTTSYFSAICVYMNFAELWNFCAVYNVVVEITATLTYFCLLISLLAKNTLWVFYPLEFSYTLTFWFYVRT